MSLGNVPENCQFNTFILKFSSVKIPIVFLSLYFLVLHFRVRMRSTIMSLGDVSENSYL